jgi:hypothetical protein
MASGKKRRNSAPKLTANGFIAIALILVCAWALGRILHDAIEVGIKGAYAALKTPLGRQTVLSPPALLLFCVLLLSSLGWLASIWAKFQLFQVLRAQPGLFLRLRHLPYLGRGIVRLAAQTPRWTRKRTIDIM